MQRLVISISHLYLSRPPTLPFLLSTDNGESHAHQAQWDNIKKIKGCRTQRDGLGRKKVDVAWGIGVGTAEDTPGTQELKLLILKLPEIYITFLCSGYGDVDGSEHKIRHTRTGQQLPEEGPIK
ncbi:hypothetical protein AMTR_s00136p00114690 [Amborella trichopoda]|uniref:Uncharacterized protein n=1 Tax=Amborella trichopoda TaxID=13333 RepID=W1NF07_AMBTC|nr:hypothetical protein AMTR_s00136p00114690 [Amborella trichopoda]